MIPMKTKGFDCKGQLFPSDRCQGTILNKRKCLLHHLVYRPMNGMGVCARNQSSLRSIGPIGKAFYNGRQPTLLNNDKQYTLGRTVHLQRIPVFFYQVNQPFRLFLIPRKIIVQRPMKFYMMNVAGDGKKEIQLPFYALKEMLHWQHQRPPTKILAVGIGRMCANGYAMLLCQGHRSANTLFVSTVAPTGDGTTTDERHERSIITGSFPQITIDIDARFQNISPKLFTPKKIKKSSMKIKRVF